MLKDSVDIYVLLNYFWQCSFNVVNRFNLAYGPPSCYEARSHHHVGLIDFHRVTRLSLVTVHSRRKMLMLPGTPSLKYADMFPNQFFSHHLSTTTLKDKNIKLSPLKKMFFKPFCVNHDKVNKYKNDYRR